MYSTLYHWKANYAWVLSFLIDGIFSKLSLSNFSLDFLHAVYRDHDVEPEAFASLLEEAFQLDNVYLLT